MATYEDTADESASLGETLGSNIDALALQEVAMNTEIVPWGVRDFPTDGLVVRYDFEEGGGKYTYNRVPEQPLFGLSLSNVGNLTRWVKQSANGIWSLHVDRAGSFGNVEREYAVYASGGFSLIRSSWWRTNLKNYSLSAWVKKDWGSISAESHAYISSNGYRATNASSNYSINASYTTGWHMKFRYGVFQFEGTTPSGGTVTLGYPATGLSAGFHLFTVTNSGRYIRMYIDGQLVDSYDYGSEANVYWDSRNTSMHIGHCQSDDDQLYEASQLDGLIDDFNIWNRALSPTEVLALYYDVLYAPCANESVSISEVAAYGDEIILDALVEAFTTNATGKTDISIIVSDMLDAYGWIGSTLNGQSSNQYHSSVFERTSFGPLLIGIRAHLDEIKEIVSKTDTSQGIKSVITELAEMVGTQDTVFTVETLVAMELLSINDGLSSAGSAYHRELAERLNIRSVIVASWIAMLQDGIDISDTATWDMEKIIELIENVSILTNDETRLYATGAVSIALAMLEVTEAGKGVEVAETTNLDEIVLNKAMAYLDELERISTTDSVSTFMIIHKGLSDSIHADADLSSTARLQTMVEDGIAFIATFGIDGQTFTGWVLNTESFAVSEYSNYPFNSFAQIAGKYYGANSNGLYLLEGDTDDGEKIQAKVMLGSTDMGSKQQSNLREVYMGVRTDGRLVLKTVTDDNRERWYQQSSGNSKLRDMRYKLMRGVRSNYWQVGFENVDGSDFELSSIELINVELSRH